MQLCKSSMHIFILVLQQYYKDCNLQYFLMATIFVCGKPFIHSLVTTAQEVAARLTSQRSYMYVRFGTLGVKGLGEHGTS